MPRQRLIVKVPTMVGYVPPKGYMVFDYQKLEDGTYEVTLEPWEFVS